MENKNIIITKKIIKKKSMTLVRAIISAAKSWRIINYLQRQLSAFALFPGEISPGIFTMKFFVYFSFKRNFAVKNDD